MKKLWTLIAGMALVMSSCSDDSSEPAGPAGGKDFATLTEITASLPSTRAALGDHDYEDALKQGLTIKTIWSEGDYISVWSLEDRNRVLLYHLKSGAGTETAVFELDDENETGVVGKTFVALYNGSDTPSKQVTIDKTQYNNSQYPESNIEDGAAPMAAMVTVEDGNLSNANFVFNNLCGIMAVTLTPDETASLASITITSTANLSGSGLLELKNGKLGFTFSSAESTSVVRQLSNYQLTAGDPATFSFVVPAAAYGLLKIDVMSSTSLQPVWSRRRIITGAGLAVSAGSITRIANVKLKLAAPHVYKEGDFYPNGATTADAVKGIVYEVSEDGLSGKMIYPKTLGSAKWTTLTSFDNIPLSESNGELNMNVAKEAIESYPAFQLVANLAQVDNKTWYIPSKAELQDLIPSINVINRSYKNIEGNTGSLIPLSTVSSVRNWSSTGYVGEDTEGNPVARAWTARYTRTYNEELDEDVSEWRVAGASASSSYNVIAIAKFESK